MNPLIYEPTGKALEYIPDGYALNVYLGCSFGCTYPCYNVRLKDFIEPRVRKQYDIKLAGEVKDYSGKKVFLSFLSDPYQELEHEKRYTRFTLILFLMNNITPVLLTKGFIPEEDWLLFTHFSNFHFGHTLLFEDIRYGMKYEPGAASLGLRKVQLQKAHTLGLTTWISLEPVIDVDEAIKVVKETSGYVDYYRIGAWNYNVKAKDVDYKRFVEELLMMECRYRFMFKQSLKKYFPNEETIKLYYPQ